MNLDHLILAWVAQLNLDARDRGPTAERSIKLA